MRKVDDRDTVVVNPILKEISLEILVFVVQEISLFWQICDRQQLLHSWSVALC